MNPLNKQILDECREHYDFYVRTETIEIHGMHRITFHQLKELERIVKEEFLPDYSAVLAGCGTCIGDHLRLVYKKYDEWIARQPVIVAATFPVNDPPKFVDGPLEDNPEVYESVISKRAEKRKQQSLKRHGK